jgi:hypothetical protein
MHPIAHNYNLIEERITPALIRVFLTDILNYFQDCGG